ncbi:hypothetical protein DFH07DRAFT_781566 [Mycena maculata]|uniref:Uncharacterized protein n=1 Tax=Mycena maculata TaxID=230809 RepID=A0AAD7HXQ8_9AGAR|nr:hypothetical protein DFH07DRAFT_781566 [Mycena maculata]
MVRRKVREAYEDVSVHEQPSWGPQTVRILSILVYLDHVVRLLASHCARFGALKGGQSTRRAFDARRTEHVELAVERVTNSSVVVAPPSSQECLCNSAHPRTPFGGPTDSLRLQSLFAAITSGIALLRRPLAYRQTTYRTRSEPGASSRRENIAHDFEMDVHETARRHAYPLLRGNLGAFISTGHYIGVGPISRNLSDNFYLPFLRRWRFISFGAVYHFILYFLRKYVTRRGYNIGGRLYGDRDVRVIGSRRHFSSSLEAGNGSAKYVRGRKFQSMHSLISGISAAPSFRTHFGERRKGYPNSDTLCSVDPNLTGISRPPLSPDHMARPRRGASPLVLLHRLAVTGPWREVMYRTSSAGSPRRVIPVQGKLKADVHV